MGPRDLDEGPAWLWVAETGPCPIIGVAGDSFRGGPKRHDSMEYDIVVEFDPVTRRFAASVAGLPIFLAGPAQPAGRGRRNESG